MVNPVVGLNFDYLIIKSKSDKLTFFRFESDL